MKLNRILLICTVVLIAILIPVAFGMRYYAYFYDLDVATGFFHTESIACNGANGIGLFVFALCLLLAAIKKDLPAPKKKEKKVKAVRIEEEEPDLFAQEEQTKLFAASEDTGLFAAEEDAVLYPEEDEIPHDENFSFPEEEENLFLEEDGGFLEENPLNLPLLEGAAKKASIWTGTLSAFASFLPGFGFIAYAIAFFLQNRGEANAFSSVHMILSVLSALFFLIFSFRNSPKKSKIFAFFALSPAFWCTLRMVIEYRDLTRFMNKPLYVGQFLFIISVLVFFLYQAELLLGEKNVSNPNFYAFFAASTLFFGLSARLPHLIAGIGGKVSLDLFDASSLLIDLTITLFAATKLSAFLKKD